MFPIRLVNPKRAWDEGKKTETGSGLLIIACSTGRGLGWGLKRPTCRYTHAGPSDPPDHQ